jgi:hypothetical protein
MAATECIEDAVGDLNGLRRLVPDSRKLVGRDISSGDAKGS